MRNVTEREREEMCRVVQNLQLPQFETMDRREAVQECFYRIAKRHRAVGAQLVLLPQNGQMEIYSYGRARLHPDVPVTHDTGFRVASITKLVSTFGILSLVEEGQLSLDEDIGEALGYSVRSPEAPGQRITLRMLLTHTAGLRNIPLAVTDGPLQGRLSDPAVWRDTAPGDSFLYSNFGAGIVGALAESVAGKYFGEIMQERIFEPLHVRAGYGISNYPDKDRVANGYLVLPMLPPMLRYSTDMPGAAVDRQPGEDYSAIVGRLILDAEGIGRMMEVLLGRTRILREETIREMLTCQDGIGGIKAAGRGLNVAFLRDTIPGRSLAGHQGVAYGMCSELFVDTEHQCGVAVMINGAKLGKMILKQIGLECLTLGFAALGG